MHSRRRHVRAFQAEKQARWFAGLESALRSSALIPFKLRPGNVALVVVSDQNLPVALRTPEARHDPLRPPSIRAVPVSSLRTSPRSRKSAAMRCCALRFESIQSRQVVPASMPSFGISRAPGVVRRTDVKNSRLLG